MKNKLQLGIIIVFAFLIVGYASVTTNVFTSGEARVGAFDPNNFELTFTSATPETNGSAVIDSVNGRTITYQPVTLSSIGDIASLSFVVTNNSTQFDADVEIQYTYSGNYDEYLNITKVGFPDNQLIRVYGKDSSIGELNIEVTETPAEPINLEITLSLSITAVSRVETAVSLNEMNPATSSRFGIDTSNVNLNTNGTAKLDIGESTNLRLKRIAALANGISEAAVNTYTVNDYIDTYITSIEWSETAPTQAQKVKYGQLGMTASSPLGMGSDGTTNDLIITDVPIWAWYDNGTIYIWSSDSTIDMHPDSERMFQGLSNLTNVSVLSHFNATPAETLRYEFKGTKINDFSVIDNWNIITVKTSLISGNELNADNNGFYQMCNGVINNNHPNFTVKNGTWNSDGTFTVSNE
jgi:hypothetical protein